MSDLIQLKRSSVANAAPTTLADGELALNFRDGKLYYRNHTGAIVEFAGGGGGEDATLRAFFLPPAPTSLTASAGNAQATLSWTAPTVLAQTPITDYVVQFSSNSGSTWTTFSDGTSTATSATVTGLTNGTGYVFRVAAVNGVGTGAYASATSSVTPGDVFRAIPTMTSYTAPSGEVTYVSTLEDSGFAAWKAFDGSASTGVYFLRASGNNPSRMLQYAFPSGQKSRISGYSMQFYFPGYGNGFTQWKVYGSDDLDTWTLIDSRSGQSFDSESTTGTFSLESVANYRAYRWVFQDTADQSGDNIIGTLQLLE
jgi:hypothetical protein